MPDELPVTDPGFEEFTFSSQQIREARLAFGLAPDPDEETPEPRLDATERANEMCRLRAAGVSLDEIGLRFDVTRERVRQILLQVGGPTAQDAKRAQQAQRLAEQDRVSSAIATLLDERGPSSVEQVAERLGLSPEEANRLWPREKRAYKLRPNHMHSRWTEEDIFEALRAAATYDFPLRSTRYDSLVAAGEVDGPSAMRIMQRLGSWSRACELAGVEPAKAARSDYQSTWTDEDLLGFVRLYIEEAGGSASFVGYDQWQRLQAEAPSGGTLRNRLGSWTRTKQLALGGSRD